MSRPPLTMKASAARATAPRPSAHAASTASPAAPTAKPYSRAAKLSAGAATKKKAGGKAKPTGGGGEGDGDDAASAPSPAIRALAALLAARRDGLGLASSAPLAIGIIGPPEHGTRWKSGRLRV